MKFKFLANIQSHHGASGASGKIVTLLVAQIAVARALTPSSAPKAKEVYMPSMLATIWQRHLPVLIKVWSTSWRQMFRAVNRNPFISWCAGQDHCRSCNSIFSQRFLPAPFSPTEREAAYSQPPIFTTNRYTLTRIFDWYLSGDYRFTALIVLLSSSRPVLYLRAEHSDGSQTRHLRPILHRATSLLRWRCMHAVGACVSRV